MKRTKEEIRLDIQSETKRCYRCKQVKPFKEFSVSKHVVDGRRGTCKDCISNQRSSKRIPQRDRADVRLDIQLGSKVCTICKERKDFELFHVYSLTQDGRQSMCKSCNSTYSKRQRIKEYGITLEYYDEMYEGQGGLCYICKNGGDLYIDHNHEDGEVRGLLCPSCNTALGLMRDSPKVLAGALAYLREKGYYGEEE